MTAGRGYGLAALLALAAACAPTGRAPRMGTPPDLQEPEHINTPAVQSLDGFSQAVRAGTSLYVSDQVALDSTGKLVGVSSLPVQGLRVAIDATAHVRGMFIDRDRLPGAPLGQGR